MTARARATAPLILALVLVGPAHADTGQLPSTHPRGAKTLVVDIKRGRDANPGTARRPIRTVSAAWQRIPPRRKVRRPVRILVRPGRYGARALPNYWESRWGSRRAPIVVAAQRRGTVSFGAVNLFDLRWVSFAGIRFRDRFDLFHCERCQHVLLTRSRLVGAPTQLHENIKVNQSRHVGITRNFISGAEDNAIDFVSVQYARVTDNTIERANDWCAYAKGGSAFLLFARNRIRRCGTGGFTAGQGTGFQFMTRPFIRHEAYGIKVLDNRLTDIEGAGVGVNGAYNTIVARNRMWNVGRRSHWLEVGYGSRSCDGRPGDELRDLCQRNLDAGGWGTTRVDDGTNFVRIPNRHVAILGNVIDNPRPHGDQLFSIAGPFSGEAQSGSGLGSVRADDDLSISSNVIAGQGLPPGADDCTAADCRAITQRNSLAAPTGLFRSPQRGDLRMHSGRQAPRPRLPRWSWADAGGVRP